MNHFVIAEPSKCIGCNTCMAACIEAHKEVGLVEYARLTVVRDNDNGTAPVLCRHCEDAPCAKVCPVNAIAHVDNAILLNESLCIGCKLCGLACPFGAITPAASDPVDKPECYEHYIPESMLNQLPSTSISTSPFLAWNVGRKMIAVKCDLCHFSVIGPACINSCPTDALFLVSDNIIDKVAKIKQETVALSAELVDGTIAKLQGE